MVGHLSLVTKTRAPAKIRVQILSYPDLSMPERHGDYPESDLPACLKHVGTRPLSGRINFQKSAGSLGVNTQFPAALKVLIDLVGELYGSPCQSVDRTLAAYTTLI